MKAVGALSTAAANKQRDKKKKKAKSLGSSGIFNIYVTSRKRLWEGYTSDRLHDWTQISSDQLFRGRNIFLLLIQWNKDNNEIGIYATLGMCSVRHLKHLSRGHYQI